MAHQPKAGDALNEREALGISLAERIALDLHTVTDEFFAKLREHFTDDEITEMVFACGIFNWGNKFNITMNMDSSDESDYETDMQYAPPSRAARRQPCRGLAGGGGSRRTEPGSRRPL